LRKRKGKREERSEACPSQRKTEGLFAKEKDRIYPTGKMEREKGDVIQRGRSGATQIPKKEGGGKSIKKEHLNKPKERGGGKIKSF